MRKTALGRAKVGKVRSKIIAADLAVMARISAANSLVPEKALPALSRAANYSGLWMGIAAVLGIHRGQMGRRAALRGVVSIAIASTASNVLGKGLAPTALNLQDFCPVVPDFLGDGNEVGAG